MDSSDTNLEKSCDIEQMTIIGKIHSMQWLKSNSQSSGHTKAITDGKESKSNVNEIEIDEGTEGSSKVLPIISVSNDSELEYSKDTSKVDSDETNSNIRQNIETVLNIVGLVKKDMETIWNKDVNVANTLFPNSQSLVIQKLDEEEMMSMALAESIVTAQLEQFRFNGDEKNKSDTPHNESDDDWSTICHNHPDLPKSEDNVGNEVSSKQCHDNNNNNAKSKTQSSSEVKKGMQKTGMKLSVKKSNDQKAKRVTGNTLKESCTSSKQGSKNDFFNLSSDDNKASITATDTKKSGVAVTSKFTDKYGRYEGYNNRQLFTGKGVRMKEQQFLRQQFSMFNETSNKSKSSSDDYEENAKSANTKLKSPRADSSKKYNDIDDTRKCQKAQVMRAQSYNAQYSRNKPLIKTQPRYSKVITKAEQETPNNQQTSAYNSNIYNQTTEIESRRRCENDPSKTDRQFCDIKYGQGTSEKNLRSSDYTSEYTGNDSNNVKPMGSVQHKVSLQNPSAKSNVEKNTKDDQGYSQRFKKDSNVFRRSSDYSELKHLNTKAKVDDHKRNVDNNSTKDYKVSRMCSTDVKLRSQPENTRAPVNSTKLVTGANKTNKTDASSTINDVQPEKLPNSCSNESTKVSTTSISAPVRVQQEPQTLQASYKETEVQSIVKTEQENNNSISNNKASIGNTEMKSVKFSDNIQEINVSERSAISYPNNSSQYSKSSMNSFYHDLQNTPQSITDQTETHQHLQNKNYYDNTAQYNDSSSANVQSTDRNLHFLDTMQHKMEQNLHASSQSATQQSTPNSTENVLHYQTMPGMYLNQYSNVQTVPRKTSDGTNVSQNQPIQTTPSYNTDNQNLLQNDPSNVFMHGSHTPILPPPGFHNHLNSPHNQWNIPLSDMLYFGNMMSPAHPLNMQIQNSRHVCGTDYNSLQQPGYLQQPLFYMPPFCMQNWNPLLQYPAPLFQNPQYTNCATYPNQLMPTSNLADSLNCSVPTSAPNNPYKHFQQIQQLDGNTTNYTTPMKFDNYMGNVQSYKSNNMRMKDMDMRTSQYRAPVPNEYQNCPQEGQPMTSYSYPTMLDSIARNGQSNMQMQMSQKYHGTRLVGSANYPRMTETSSSYLSGQDSSRKDDSSKNDTECIPPMVSPRECMYHGVNYSRKTSNVRNSSMNSEMKPMGYMHSGNSQHCVPQFHKTTNYQVSPRDLNTRVNVERGTRKSVEQ